MKIHQTIFWGRFFILHYLHTTKMRADWCRAMLDFGFPLLPEHAALLFQVNAKNCVVGLSEWKSDSKYLGERMTKVRTIQGNVLLHLDYSLPQSANTFKTGKRAMQDVVSWGTNSNPACDNPRQIFFSQCCFEKFRLSVSEAKRKKKTVRPNISFVNQTCRVVSLLVEKILTLESIMQEIFESKAGDCCFGNWGIRIFWKYCLTSKSRFDRQRLELDRQQRKKQHCGSMEAKASSFVLHAVGWVNDARK